MFGIGRGTRMLRIGVAIVSNVVGLVRRVSMRINGRSCARYSALSLLDTSPFIHS
jgi:hypothetical protein